MRIAKLNTFEDLSACIEINQELTKRTRGKIQTNFVLPPREFVTKAFQKMGFDIGSNFGIRNTCGNPNCYNLSHYKIQVVTGKQNKLQDLMETFAEFDNNIYQELGFNNYLKFFNSKYENAPSLKITERTLKQLIQIQTQIEKEGRNRINFSKILSI